MIDKKETIQQWRQERKYKNSPDYLLYIQHLAEILCPGNEHLKKLQSKRCVSGEGLHVKVRSRS